MCFGPCKRCRWSAAGSGNGGQAEEESEIFLMERPQRSLRFPQVVSIGRGMVFELHIPTRTPSEPGDCLQDRRREASCSPLSAGQIKKQGSRVFVPSRHSQARSNSRNQKVTYKDVKRKLSVSLEEELQKNHKNP